MKLNNWWQQVGLLFFTYHNDARSNIHKISTFCSGISSYSAVDFHYSLNDAPRTGRIILNVAQYNAELVMPLCYCYEGVRPSSSILTYLLTPWCRVLEKLTGLQLVKKFPAFHGTRRFITALTSVRHLSLSWASPIQSIYPHPTSWT